MNKIRHFEDWHLRCSLLFQTMKIKAFFGAALLAAVTTSQATVLFQVETDFDVGPLGGDTITKWGLNVQQSGGGTHITGAFEFQDSVLTRDETSSSATPRYGFWDHFIAGDIDDFKFTTERNTYRYVFPTIPDATGVNYLYVTFPTPGHVVVQGLDVLDGIPDVGPVPAPDSGSVAGLLGLGVASIGLLRRKLA